MLSNLPISPLSRALRWLVWLIAVALFLLISCLVSLHYIESAAHTVQVDKLKRIENDTLPDAFSKSAITVATLLTTPQKYQNRCVWVKGYLNLEFEGDAIYWRQIDYRANNYRNALWVIFTDSLLQTKRVTDYSKRYVLVKGIFDSNITGHGSLNPGAITNITSLNSLQRNAR